MKEDSTTYQEKELSIKELILIIQEYALYLLSKWKYIVLAGVVGLVLGFVVHKLTKAKYGGVITFVVEQEEGGGMASSLASFGLPNLGGGGYNYDKVLTIATSKRVLYQTLLDTLGEDRVLHKYVEVFDLEEDIIESFDAYEPDRLVDTLENQSLYGNRLLKYVYGHILKEGIITINYDLDSGVFTLSATTPSGQLSYALSKNTYNNLSSFYYYQATNKYAENTEIIRNRMDSVTQKLQAKEVELATATDRSNNLFSARDRLTKERAARDVQILTAAYGELLKRFESSRFILESTRPVFTIIDDVQYPLNWIKRGLIKTVFIFTFLSLFLTVAYLLGKKIYSDIMEES